MNEQTRNCLIALLSLGLAMSYSMAASAQIIAADPPAVIIEDDDDPAVIVDDYDDDPAVIVEDDYDDEPTVVIANRDGMDRCAATFRSFDPDSGTYVTYAGETVRCPYLE